VSEADSISVEDEKAESGAEDVCAGLSGSGAEVGSVEDEKAESGADDVCVLAVGGSEETTGT
jgi:hypothetical protein